MQIDRIGHPQSRLTVREPTTDRIRVDEQRVIPDHAAAFSAAVESIDAPEHVEAVGHRVVRAARHHASAETISPPLMKELESMTASPLAGSWKSVAYLNPARDGAVLPILYLNGYKIGGPTFFGRLSDDDIRGHIGGAGYDVDFVEGDDPAAMHQALAAALDRSYARVRTIQHDARSRDVSVRSLDVGHWSAGCWSGSDDCRENRETENSKTREVPEEPGPVLAVLEFLEFSFSASADR